MRKLRSISSLFASIAGLVLTLPFAAERGAASASTPASAACNSRGQTAQRADALQLEPGVSVERELIGGDAHQYRIVMTAGQYVELQIIKQGVDITVSWKSPTGEVLFIADLEQRERGVESISLIAKNDGPQTLVIEPTLKQSPRGRYHLKLDEIRQATEKDAQQFTAQQVFLDAVERFNKETAEAQQDALRKLSESLTLFQAIGDREWEARVVFWMGSIELALNKHADAFDHLNRALELRRASGDATGEAETLRTIGMVRLAQAKSREALEFFNKALDLQKASAERGQLAFTYSQLGAVYWMLGDHEKMNGYFAQALQVLREIGNTKDESRVLTSLSFIHMTQGIYQTGLDILPRAIDLFREIKDLEGEAAALNSLGTVYYNLGETQSALGYFNQSLSRYDALQYPRNQAFVLTNLGIAYSTLGDKREALTHFAKALRLTQAVNNPRGEANLLRHIGKVRQELGELKEALNHFNRTLELARKQNDPSGEARALRSIGEVYAAMGDNQKALDYLNQALPISRRIREHSGEARTLFWLAHVERDQGELRAAKMRAEEALQIIESLRAKVAGNELRSSFFAENQEYYELYIDILMRLHDELPESGYDALALQAGESARARALLDSLAEARADIREGIAPNLLARERSLHQQLNASEERRVRLASVNPASEQVAAADRDVSATLDALRDVRAQIRTTSPNYAALTEPQPIYLKEVQANLDKDTMLLVYSLGTKRSFLWAVTPTILRSYVIAPRARLAGYAEEFARVLKVSHHRRQSKQQAKLAVEKISENLLGPVADQLSGKRLVIVADGALQRIPFAALVAPGGERPLIVEHEIVNLPSVSVLGQLRRRLAGRAPAAKTLAIVADPIFQAQDPRIRALPANSAEGRSTPTTYANPLAAVTRAARDAGLEGFGRLEYSRVEAEQICRLIPEAECDKFLDFDASRAVLTERDLGKYRILHFATHSFIDEKNPELSGIVLSLYDKERRPQDGFLRAHEVYNLKLGADLVVLSACNTALGKQVRGEGLISLTRGFMYAGAPRIVVSLWDVDDIATAELMKRFYEGMMRKKLSQAAALRAAQAAMAQDQRWKLPYFWAGFILQGEWR